MDRWLITVKDLEIGDARFRGSYEVQMDLDCVGAVGSRTRGMWRVGGMGN